MQGVLRNFFLLASANNEFCLSKVKALFCFKEILCALIEFKICRRVGKCSRYIIAFVKIDCCNRRLVCWGFCKLILRNNKLLPQMRSAKCACKMCEGLKHLFGSTKFIYCSTGIIGTPYSIYAEQNLPLSFNFIISLSGRNKAFLNFIFILNSR